MKKIIYPLFMSLFLAGNAFADNVSSCLSQKSAYGFSFFSDINWAVNSYPVVLLGKTYFYDKGHTVQNMPDYLLGMNDGDKGKVFLWEPGLIVETTSYKGCSNSMGTKIPSNLGSGSTSLFYGKASTRAGDGASSNLKFVHVYNFPATTAFLGNTSGIFGDSIANCVKNRDISLIYASEFDFTWGDELNENVYFPESVLFTSLSAKKACLEDRLNSYQGKIDKSLFWCMGSWGSVYPMAGTSYGERDDTTINSVIMAKILERFAMAGKFEVDGDTLNKVNFDFSSFRKTAGKYYLFNLIRIDPVSPFSYKGTNPVYLGKPFDLWTKNPRLINKGSLDDGVFVIFEGRFCHI